MRTVWLNRLPQRDLRMFPQAALLQKPHSAAWLRDRKSTRLNSSHLVISYAVFCLKKKKNFTRLQVAIQNMVASNIGISQSIFSIKVLNLFSRSRRKTNKRKSKHSAMLRNKETRHRMFIGLLNTTRKLA